MLNIMSRPNIPPPKTTPVALPPKPRTEKHWSQTIQETVVSAVPEDSHGISISGGADNGLFCFISDIRQDQLTYYSGKLYAEDIVLEIQGQKIAGYTLRDATIWLKQVSQNGTPVMIKTVRTGQLPRDLRQFLTSRFQKGSVDHDLQQTIRDNLYLRTVPCTTRSPRPGEVNGVDYTFLSLEEFIALEKTGCLLESGLYDGNHYGTPKPPSEPKGQVIRRSSSIGAVLPGAHPSSDGKRRRNRSNTEGGSSKSSPVPFQDERNRKMSLEKAQSESSLGILPANWEKAFTDEGTPYFIDHSTETTHWLDPRLAHLQKQQPQDCDDGGRHAVIVRKELPFGWEKVEDPHYGTYYIDHVNRKTQYENPVTQAKRINQGNDLNSTLPRTKKSQDSAKRSASDSNMNGRGAPPDYSRHHGKGIRVKKEKRIFTKNPSELKGENIQTTLVKSVRGFGFTIIGGDHTDEEFLQIKKVVENGPAHQDGTLKTGDVLVNVDDRCVLGYSHQDIVNLFQTIPPNQSVTLTINRGYTLPFDPDDPNTEIIVTLAVTLPSGSNTNQSPPSYSSIHDNHGNMDQHNTSAKSLKSLPDLTRSANLNSHSIVSQQKNGNTYNSSDAPDLLGLYQKPETISINIVRGEMGFGFTIADSAYGQRVKQILDKGRCKTLQEGDILQEINHVNVREMSHTQIVQVLKDCPKGVETEIVIQRGGIPQRVKKPSKSPRPMDDSKSFPASDTSFGSNNQPGQYFFDANHSNAADKSESISKENSDQDIQEKCDNKDMVDGPEPITRPKTPTSTDARPKTPSFNDSRPKTPTRIAGMNVNDSRGKPPLGGRPPVPEMQNMKISDPHAPRREYVPQEDQYNKDYGSQDLNQSRGSSEFYQNVGNFDVNSRPPPGPRYDQFRNDHGQRPYGRQDSGGHVRQNHTMHNFHDRESRYDHNRGETAKPGMFRSRTPGPELLSRGPDYRNEFQRPKTPTAQEMRSKTPVPGQSFGYSSSANPDFLPGRYQNSFGANGHRQGPSQRSWGPRSPDFPVSPPPLRRGDHFDSSDNRNNIKPFSQAGPGRPPRQSTSFEDVDPTPSNITRVPKRFPLHPNSSLNSQIQQSPRLPPRFHDREEPVRTVEFNITLQKQENGFGFRIIGGTEEGSQVSVGHIVPNGAADLDGRLRTGDEITHVDNMSVINSSHHRVVQMMGLAGQQGHVTLGVRRRVLGGTTDSGYNSTGMQDTYPYDITVTRRETEGFGFVIISSVSKSGSVIGRILENSPAERCGRLQIGDRILAVNGVDISHMLHEDIVNLIKDSGYSVTLTVGPPQDDASSTASNSQRSSQGSMVNAMAYPAVGENEIRRFPPPVPVERNFKDMNRQRSVSNHQSSPEDAEYYNVELSRGSRGFGFSIRGGQEFNCMPLFVLRIAEGGSADLDGRLRVGDQILEINGYKTDMMTHSDAIDIIQNGGQTVRLLIKRTGKLPPAFENNAISGRYPPPNMPMSNGPIGQSSPYLGRRNIEHREDPNFYYNQGGRQYTGY